MKCAAAEMVRLVTNNSGKTREVVRVVGEIRKQEFWGTMAVFKAQTSQQWHLEQWYPLKGMWLSAEIQYRLMCRRSLLLACQTAKGNPEMFRVVFRDEHTGKETVIDGAAQMEDEMRKLSGPVIHVDELSKHLPPCVGETPKERRARQKRELKPAYVAANSRNVGAVQVENGKRVVFTKPTAWVDGQFLAAE